MTKYVVIYGVIKEKDDNLTIDGPFYHNCRLDKAIAESDAREVANTKASDLIIIPWVLETENSIPNIMLTARDTWFSRFRRRTIGNAETLNRCYNNNSCPFSDVPLQDILEYA